MSGVSVDDAFVRVAAIGARLAELGAEIQDLSGERQKLVRELHLSGYSHAEIARAAGVSRGRVFQILRAEERAAVLLDVED